jgi:hypothetical protein
MLIPVGESSGPVYKKNCLMMPKPQAKTLEVWFEKGDGNF